MNPDLPSNPEPQVDAELAHLVDGFIDDRLSDDERRQLEERLLKDEHAMEYCADRISFHADMQELLHPIRVEVIQKRHFVFERKNGLPRFAVRESQVTQIGTPGSDTFIEIPPDIVQAEDTRKKAFMVGAIVLTLIATIIALLIHYNSSNNDGSAAHATLALRNPSFESTDLSNDEDAYSYILNDWQDHFITTRAGICEIGRYSQGKISAPAGKNVAMLKPRSYLTQRLRSTDDSPLLVQPGLHIQIKGQMYGEATKKIEEPQNLRLALRVVQSIIPEMVQYEPQFIEIPVKKEGWQTFVADFHLPANIKDLTLKPSDVMEKTKANEEFNINGKPLNLSIDNRSQTTIYLDDLSIEVVSPSGK